MRIPNIMIQILSKNTIIFWRITRIIEAFLLTEKKTKNFFRENKINTRVFVNLLKLRAFSLCSGIYLNVLYFMTKKTFRVNSFQSMNSAMTIILFCRYLILWFEDTLRPERYLVIFYKKSFIIHTMYNVCQNIITFSFYATELFDKKKKNNKQLLKF